MWAKIKSSASSIWMDMCDTYSRIKIYLLGIIAILAVLEWRKIKEAALVKLGQKEITSANRQDQALAKTESIDKEQANALEQDAAQLPSIETPVTDDWNTK